LGLTTTDTRLAKEHAVALVSDHRETARRSIQRIGYEGKTLLAGRPFNEGLSFDKSSFEAVLGIPKG
jgi:hypothetical protein